MLFALAIEPLAMALRSSCEYSGIFRAGFGQISGYKLNVNKSTLFPIKLLGGHQKMTCKDGAIFPYHWL
ncbi:hypothetical protein F7725_024499 [Dissostichus mawsoni]|uniref:Uncharacterized protein n=1 Tax=Dissostichus mawsoni TaxID=36200 RepID=A0A7J5Y2I0_DISMA|nr:hypothetical protein F7725_024499 [Dissostichus mawsoni]